MMELGAVVCTGNNEPACSTCPIQGQCRAFGQQQAFLQSGGTIFSPDAPLVTQYPTKVGHGPDHLHLMQLCTIADSCA